MANPHKIAGALGLTAIVAWATGLLKTLAVTSGYWFPIVGGIYGLGAKTPILEESLATTIFIVGTLALIASKASRLLQKWGNSS